MDKESKKIIYSFIPGILFVAALWIVFGIEQYSGFRLSEYGVQPRTISGLKGIIASPFLHGDIRHLTSNSVPMLILLSGLIYFYREISFKVLAGVWILGGFWLWLGGRDSYHIGASGIIYGLTAFLFFSGLFRRDNRLMALSLLVVFLYGGMVWGIFPLFREISWEAHLFGAFAGILMAWIYRAEGPQKVQYDWEHEEDEEDEKDENNSGEATEQAGIQIHYIYKKSQEEPGSPDEKN